MVFGGVVVGNCLDRRSGTLGPGITNDAARHLPQTRKRDEGRDVWIVTARRGWCLAAGVAWPIALYDVCVEGWIGMHICSLERGRREEEDLRVRTRKDLRSTNCTLPVTVMSLEAAQGLSIFELLRVLNEKLVLGCTRLRHTPLPPVTPTASLELEVCMTRRLVPS